jgi:hypothetical protein
VDKKTSPTKIGLIIVDEIGFTAEPRSFATGQKCINDGHRELRA